MLTNNNGPEHLRLRALVSRAFTPRSVDALRPRMRALSREILWRHFEAGELDVLHDFSHELPIRLMCELLGVPGEHQDDFSHWSTSLGDALSAVPTSASPTVRLEGSLPYSLPSMILKDGKELKNDDDPIGYHQSYC